MSASSVSPSELKPFSDPSAPEFFWARPLPPDCRTRDHWHHSTDRETESQRGTLHLLKVTQPSLTGGRVKARFKPVLLAPRHVGRVPSSSEEDGASGPEMQFVPFP